MLCVGHSLKEVFVSLLHITCDIHAFHFMTEINRQWQFHEMQAQTLNG